MTRERFNAIIVRSLGIMQVNAGKERERNLRKMMKRKANFARDSNSDSEPVLLKITTAERTHATEVWYLDTDCSNFETILKLSSHHSYSFSNRC